MAGFHCSECIYGSFAINEDTGKYQGSCSRGFTLAVPHVYKEPDMFFANTPDELVPVIDPYGNEYLRQSNVCNHFLRPQDARPYGK